MCSMFGIFMDHLTQWSLADLGFYLNLLFSRLLCMFPSFFILIYCLCTTSFGSTRIPTFSKINQGGPKNVSALGIMGPLQCAVTRNSVAAVDLAACFGYIPP